MIKDIDLVDDGTATNSSSQLIFHESDWIHKNWFDENYFSYE